MPIVAHSDLPTFERLRQEGGTVLEPDRASHQDIRELHIGLLNMMPDAALAATERQFFRLVGESNQIAQFYVHPFTLEEIERSEKGRDYVRHYYENFQDLKTQGLDALIITGANVTQPRLEAEVFWEPLNEVIEWAYHNVTSTLCSCLATHAVMQFRYGQKRRPLEEKKWGVYNHQVINFQHPLVNGINTRFDVPHSRFNEVALDQFEQAGLCVLVQSEQAGVHLAVSEDLFRIIFFQGHPEYDTISLLKEYKREVLRYIHGHLAAYPPYPENYFSTTQRAILDEYRHRLDDALQHHRELPDFPEKIMADGLHNTWHDTAEAVINNWIGKVYQITNTDRRYPFMESVDLNDPLRIKAKASSR